MREYRIAGESPRWSWGWSRGGGGGENVLVKIGTWTLAKQSLGAVLKKREKTKKVQSGMYVLRCGKYAKGICFTMNVFANVRRIQKINAKSGPKII